MMKNKTSPKNGSWEGEGSAPQPPAPLVPAKKYPKQSIRIDWLTTAEWREELKNLPALEKSDCLRNRLDHWVDARFPKLKGSQNHALKMLLGAAFEYGRGY